MNEEMEKSILIERIKGEIRSMDEMEVRNFLKEIPIDWIVHYVGYVISDLDSFKKNILKNVEEYGE